MDFKEIQTSSTKKMNLDRKANPTNYLDINGCGLDH